MKLKDIAHDLAEATAQGVSFDVRKETVTRQLADCVNDTFCDSYIELNHPVRKNVQSAMALAMMVQHSYDEERFEVLHDVED